MMTAPVPALVMLAAFEDRDTLELAIEGLRKAGFHESDIAALRADGTPVVPPGRAVDWTEGYPTRGAARLSIRVVDPKWADRARDALARCGATAIDDAPLR